jgi:hypothetical protein
MSSQAFTWRPYPRPPMLTRIPFPLLGRRPILPEKKEPVGAKAVTIAAGFKCNDGIILATDLEITESTIKRVGGKSAYICIPGVGNVGIAGAGIYDVLAYACEVLSQRTRGNNLREILASLRGNIAKIYAEHIRPAYPRKEWGQALQLLVGIVTNAESEIDWRLYSSAQTILRETGPYEFVGFGRDLAYYVTKTLTKRYASMKEEGLHRPKALEGIEHLLPMKETVPLVRKIISEVKENSPYCGQGSKILKVPWGEEPSYEP